MFYKNVLGIDLHKRKSTWKLIDENQEVIWSRNVPCAPESIDLALKGLPLNYQGLPVAIEPTCGWRWFGKRLQDAGCDIHYANPYKIRLIADSRQKTDDEDAKLLAKLLQSRNFYESYRVSDEYENWRQLIRVRTSFVQKRVKVKNQIESILTATGPRLIKTAKLPEILEVQELSSLVTEYTYHIKKLDKKVQEIVKSNPTCELLLSIPAVGPITALTVVAEVGDFKRFPNAHKLAAYAGLVPSQRSSGEKVRMGRITKTGSQLLRVAMVETAIRFRASHNGKLFDWFEVVKKKRGAMRARTALARKLLTIMWSMVKNNQTFLYPQDIMKSGDLVM